jgi:uncharacterized protein
MNIHENFIMLCNQLMHIYESAFSHLLILSCTSQIASMIAKLFIYSIKNKKIDIKNMAKYGGMPSSHTVFVMSFVFGVALDPKLGWMHPLFVFSLIVSSIILIDTIRLRGTVDKINKAVQDIIDKDKNLSRNISLPNFIAHKVSEVISGIIFAFFYTFLFYLFFYHLFLN